MLNEQTWVLTGAAGRIGRRLRPSLAARVRELRVVDAIVVDAVHPAELATVADVRDQAAMDSVLRGSDGVIHLAGFSDEADFHDLAEVNIAGTYHVLEAARRGGAGRVVLASSDRATGFYPRTVRVDPAMPPRPDSFYGVSKVAMETLARLYADKFGLQVASVRIGSFEETPRDERHLSTWLSPRDCLAAFLAAMTAPDLTYSAFYAVSHNRRRWWDLAAGVALGFMPVDDAEAHVGEVATNQTSGDAGAPQGGEYASREYSSPDSAPVQIPSETTCDWGSSGADGDPAARRGGRASPAKHARTGNQSGKPTAPDVLGQLAGEPIRRGGTEQIVTMGLRGME